MNWIIQSGYLPEFNQTVPLLALGSLLLLFLGFFVARRNKSEKNLKRHIRFSNDVNRLSNARCSVNELIYELLEVLRVYEDADACFLIMPDSTSGGPVLYEAKDGVAPTRPNGARIDTDFATSMLALALDEVLIYNRSRQGPTVPHRMAYDLRTLETRPVAEDPLIEWANLLETNSFISLSIRVTKYSLGRVFLTRSHRHFKRRDIGHVIQAVDQIALVIKNTQLLDRLVSAAATKERKRISRDLHDGTIQPYIGLKLGLEALRRNRGISDGTASEVDQLIEMAKDGIDQLRCYVGRLRKGEFQTCYDLRLSEVRQYVRQFTQFYGLNVQVSGDNGLTIPGRLSEDLLFIVREGLSNIRRHTSVEHATVNLRDGRGQLVIEIIQSDEKINGHNGVTKFLPRSLSERARELGGALNVEQRTGDQTAVIVEIPV